MFETLAPKTEVVISKGELIKKLFLGGGVSVGAVVAYEFFEVLKTNPALMAVMIERIGSWGPNFVLVLVISYLVDRRFGNLICVGQEHVKAQQQMASSIESMASKDDRIAEEQRRLLVYIGSRTERMGEDMKAMLKFSAVQGGILNRRQAGNRTEAKRADRRTELEAEPKEEEKIL